MFLCGNVDAAALEQPHTLKSTLSSVANAQVSIPEAVLVNEFSSGENAGIVYYVTEQIACEAFSLFNLMLPTGCLCDGWGLYVGRAPPLP